MIKEIDKKNFFEIAFSDNVYQEDCDCTGMTDDTNKRSKSYCTFVGMGFINNDNIEGTLEANHI